MPRKNKNSQNKNQRRVQAAEGALRKMALTPALVRKTVKKAKSRKQLTDSELYVISAIHDRLLMGLVLPSSQICRPYVQRRFFFRSQLTSGATNPCASVVVNPWLAWATNLYYVRTTNDADQAQFIPTAYTSNTATVDQSFPDSAANHYTALTSFDQYIATSAEGYAGKVRPHGVLFRVIYVGTEQNMGGMIHCVHNPQQLSLCYSDDTTTGAVANFKSTFASTAQLDFAQDAVSTHRIGRTFEFVWRPPTGEFVDVETMLDQPKVSIATLNAQNTQIVQKGYLPDDGAKGAPAPLGWSTGFMLQPATGTAAAALNYYVEIEYVCDLDIVASDSATSAWIGNSVSHGTIRPHSHPQQEAHIRNGLSAVHHARSTHKISAGAVNMDIRGNPLTKQFEAYAGNLASGAMQEIGASMARGLGLTAAAA
jgi:hypothetical protein